MVAPFPSIDWSIFPVFGTICLFTCTEISWCPWDTGIASPSLIPAAAAAPTSGLAAAGEGEALGVGLPSAQQRTAKKLCVQEGTTGNIN